MSRSNRKRRTSRKVDVRPQPTTSGVGDSTDPEGHTEQVISATIQNPVCPVEPKQAEKLPRPDESTEFTGDVLSRLETLLKRFDDLDGRLDELAEPLAASRDETLRHDHHATNRDSEVRNLQAELETAWRENEELRHENESLTSALATSNAHQTVKANIGVDESLSWEDRKALIMQQMEDESFDANEFVNSLSSEAKELAGVSQSTDAMQCPESFSPNEFIESLIEQLTHLQARVQHRDDEIKELQHLLQNQSETREGGIAIGAAAIASLVDSDELIIEERERLQQLKNDWEDKFRQSEIDASLERAKLSRERQELAKRAQQLEEQIDELQREKRDRSNTPAKGRRWLAELGLGGVEESS